MTARRAYCLQDKPFPVSAKALARLRAIADEDGQPLMVAERQIERLRRSGYVTVDRYAVARVTDAGRALLARSA